MPIETTPKGEVGKSAGKRGDFFIEAILELELLQVDGQVFAAGSFHEEVRIVPLEFEGWLWLPE